MPSDLVLSIINAEENARENELIIKKNFKKFQTNIINWKDFVWDPINGGYIFLDKQKEGRIEELVIVSPTSNFSILIQVDGVVSYQGEFSRFQEITEHVSSIVASQRDNKYVLQLSNIKFNNSILIIIDVTAVTMFDRLYCKYDLEM